MCFKGGKGVHGNVYMEVGDWSNGYTHRKSVTFVLEMLFVERRGEGALRCHSLCPCPGWCSYQIKDRFTVANVMRSLEAESRNQAQRVGLQRLGQVGERHGEGRSDLLGRACGACAEQRSRGLHVHRQSCWLQNLNDRSRFHVHWYCHVRHAPHARHEGHRWVHVG